MSLAFILHQNPGVPVVRTFLQYIGNKGFSAIELLIAMIITGLLIGAAMPAFLSMVQRSRIDGGARQVLYGIRSTQSLAISRGDIFGFHWGGDPGPPAAGRLNSEYRVETDPGNICAWPAPTDTMANPNVVRDWFDLAGEYPGVTVTSVKDNLGTVLGRVIFNSRGGWPNTPLCPSPNFPVWVCVSDGSGTLRAIQIQRVGKATILPPPPLCP